MTEGTEPLPRLRPKWDACGECRRCCAGTGRTPTNPTRDCYAEFLNRAVDVAMRAVRQARQ